MPLPLSPLSSLRARLLALLLVVGLLPVIGFAGYKVWFERTSEYARAEEQLDLVVANAENVAADLGDALKLILDAGPCSVGVESTIVALAPDQPARDVAAVT